MTTTGANLCPRTTAVAGPSNMGEAPSLFAWWIWLRQLYLSKDTGATGVRRPFRYGNIEPKESVPVRVGGYRADAVSLRM